MCVCLPTYNERENLEPMLRALGRVLAEDDRVLVIDDNSPDGTGELADRLAGELAFVDVLRRPRKEGLGPAYLAGFRRALVRARSWWSRSTATSHTTRTTCRASSPPRTTSTSCSGHATCLAAASTEWGPIRRVDLGRRLELRPAGAGRPVRDLTGGFKCFRRAVLEVSRSTGCTAGYAFQIELTYRTIREGFRVQEVPIRFADRTVGGSKMSRAIVLEAIWKVPLLRLAALRGTL